MVIPIATQSFSKLEYNYLTLHLLISLEYSHLLGYGSFLEKFTVKKQIIVNINCIQFMVIIRSSFFYFQFIMNKKLILISP